MMNYILPEIYMFGVLNCLFFGHPHLWRALVGSLLSDVFEGGDPRAFLFGDPSCKGVG